MSIGDRILELRKVQGLSQGDLAKAIGVSRQAVSKWENDRAAPDSIKMIHLADVLDTDIEYLTTGRRTYARRPPVVINSMETVEVEKPVVQTVEKIVEKIVEKPVIEYIDRPILKKVYRVQYRDDPVKLVFIGLIFFILGFVFGKIL